MLAHIRENLRRWLQPAIDVLSSDAEPLTRTMTAVQTLVTTFEAHRDDLGLYLEALAQAPRMAPVGEALVDLWHDLQDLLAAQIGEMKEAGELAAGVDPPAMAALLVAVANGLAVQVAIDPRGPSLAAMAAQFSVLLVEARQPTD